MAVKVQTYFIKISFIEPVLGLSPASGEVYEKYIKSKIQKEIEKIERALNRKRLTEEEKEALEEKLKRLKKEQNEEPSLPELEQRLTVFPRDREGNLCLLNYQILGFFKETAHTFFKNGLKNKFSRYGDVWGDLNEGRYREVYFLRNGEKINQVDGLLERPLRAITPSGQYIVSLSISEILNPPLEMKFYLRIYGDKRFHGIDEKLIREILEYGEAKGGLGQWRTAGYGKFSVLEFRKEE
jgi:hypothetical protein